MCRTPLCLHWNSTREINTRPRCAFLYHLKLYVQKKRQEKLETGYRSQNNAVCEKSKLSICITYGWIDWFPSNYPIWGTNFIKSHYCKDKLMESWTDSLIKIMTFLVLLPSLKTVLKYEKINFKMLKLLSLCQTVWPWRGVEFLCFAIKTKLFFLDFGNL